jgi:hypothetical protein
MRALNRYRMLLAAFMIVCVAALIAALCLKPEEFAFHLMIEITVAAATLVLTVLVVEDMLEHRRRKERAEQWAVVKKNTLVSLWRATYEMAFYNVQLLFPDDYLSLEERRGVSTLMKPTVEEAEHLHKLLARLSQYVISVDPSSCRRLDPGRMREWYRASKPYLSAISDRVVPRLAQFAPDHPVMMHVLQIESLSGNLDELEQTSPTAKLFGSPDAVPIIGITDHCVAVYAILTTEEEDAFKS